MAEELATYEQGEIVILRETFTDDMLQSPVDPASVIFQYVRPSGAIVSMRYGLDLHVMRDGIGLYHVSLIADEIGRWRYKWLSTGSGAASYEYEFEVI